MYLTFKSRTNDRDISWIESFKSEHYTELISLNKRESINHLKLIWQSATFAFGGKGVIFIVNFLPVWKHSGNSCTKNTDQMSWKDVKPHLESKKKPGLYIFPWRYQWGLHGTENRPFTDTAAILNLLDLRSIMGCPGALAQYFCALFAQKENFKVHFSGKRWSYYISKHSTTIFFSHYNLFLGKLRENLARKARVNTDSSILDRPHAPWASHNTP